MKLDPAILKRPIFFEKNRVGRIYTGGALFADFFGDDSTDGYTPEEWVASAVMALNKDSGIPKEGISKLRGTDIYLDDLLAEHRAALLGDRAEFGVLTKVLDSAIRLPAQAHPDKAFSRQYFNSNYGKAESWIVLACRPDACLYFGFNKPYTKKELAAAVAASETDDTAFEGMMNKIPVAPGDVFFVPAKMAHAIGKGCLILEIQEPSDFTIQPEYYCGEYHLSEQEMYLGLDADTALEVFDRSVYGEAAVAMGRKLPQIVSKENGVTAEDLITYDDTPCFAVRRYTLEQAVCRLTEKPAVYVVTDGVGSIRCGETELPLRKGDYFLLPHAAEETNLKTDRTLTVVACLPPIH